MNRDRGPLPILRLLLALLMAWPWSAALATSAPPPAAPGRSGPSIDAGFRREPGSSTMRGHLGLDPAQAVAEEDEDAGVVPGVLDFDAWCAPFDASPGLLGADDPADRPGGVPAPRCATLCRWRR